MRGAHILRLQRPTAAW